MATWFINIKKMLALIIFSVVYKIISNYKRLVITVYILEQTACSVVNPIIGGNFAFPFNFTPAGQTSDSMTVAT